MVTTRFEEHNLRQREAPRLSFARSRTFPKLEAAMKSNRPGASSAEQHERSSAQPSGNRNLAVLDVPLERDVFLRSLVRELAGTLQDVVGLDDARGFVSIVGQNIGRAIDNEYRAALDVRRMNREQVADVLVDLKRRIRGDFFIVDENDDRIVLGNRACPFEEKVIGRPALCMMTSNVFGSIAADNLGYAKVELQETIAMGAPGCRVVVHLAPTAESEQVPGREYYGADSTSSAGG